MRPIFFAILLTIVSTPAFAATTWSSLDSQGFVRKAVCTTGTEAAPTLATEGLSAASLASVVVVVESGSAFGDGARLNAYTWNQFSAAWSRQPEADIELDATLKAQTIGPLNPGPVGRLAYAPSGLAAASTIILIGSPSAEGVRPQALDAYGRVYTRVVGADGGAPEVVSVSANTAAAFGAVQCSSTVPTLIGELDDRRALAVLNRGPNIIWLCPASEGCSSTTGWSVLPGGSFTLDVGNVIEWYCLADTADQVSPADTRFVEVK